VTNRVDAASQNLQVQKSNSNEAFFIALCCLTFLIFAAMACFLHRQWTRRRQGAKKERAESVNTELRDSRLTLGDEKRYELADQRPATEFPSRCSARELDGKAVEALRRESIQR
jgi:hypothetical protein